MRVPSGEIASWRVTTRPAGSKACGARFSSSGASGGRDQEQRRRRQRVLRAGEQVAIRLPLSGRRAARHWPRRYRAGPAMRSRDQPASDGVNASNTGFKSSRIDRTSRPPDQKNPCKRAALGRLEQLREAAIAGEKGRQGNAEQSVRRVGFAADRPWRPPLDREPAAMPRDRGIGRQVDAGLGPAAVADPDDRVEKADPARQIPAAPPRSRGRHPPRPPYGRRSSRK